jgi:hypothetical protein
MKTGIFRIVTGLSSVVLVVSPALKGKENFSGNYKSCIVILRMITMDWIAFISFIAGIILLIIGIALLFNLPAIMLFFEKIVGLLFVLLGIVALVFGWKLVRSV